MRGLAQNGLEVGQALSALPTILRLATAGGMGLMEASLGATAVMEAFNLGVGGLGRVADVFTKAAAVSNTSVTEMVEAMKPGSVVVDLAAETGGNVEGSVPGSTVAVCGFGGGLAHQHVSRRKH